MPDLRGKGWAVALPKGARFRDQTKVRQLRGLQWDLEQKSLQLSWKWYALEVYTVGLHMTVVYLVPLLFVFYAMAMQHTWGMLMCPVAGIDGNWECLACMSVNFASREACHRCGAGRPSQVNPPARSFFFARSFFWPPGTEKNIRKYPSPLVSFDVM